MEIIRKISNQMIGRKTGCADNKIIKKRVPILLAIASCVVIQAQVIKVAIDTSLVKHTMRGGMGASWHAINQEFPLNNDEYEIPIREIGSRGSAYGGNPPIQYKQAWEQLKSHASWLGINFIRVELSQRMYEPQKGKFDFENEEMQALFNILDWAESNGADVFLQQMWMNVPWNSFPGIHPLLSAPKNLDDYAIGITTLIEFLTKEKGYSCIKYFCMTNEPPGGTWGYWWEYGGNKGNIEDAWARLNKEFEIRGINIPISGPDWTDMPTFDESKLGFSKYLGAIDIHSYHGVTAEGEENLKKWATWTHQTGKPFFLTEYGNMDLGWGGSDPNQKSFEAALSNANDVLRAMRAGVDGFNRWSFTNRGDLDGQWQLVKTYDLNTKKYLQKVLPENEAYYGFGIISRFLSKYSSVVSCESSSDDSTFLCNAVVSPDKKTTIFLLNKSSENVEIELNFTSQIQGFYLYEVTKKIVNEPDFKLEPIETFSGKKIKFTLKPNSINTLSQNYISANDAGVVLN